MLAVILVALTAAIQPTAGPQPSQTPGLFDRDNLVAWCIVPFDSAKRSPAQRAEMLDKLGIHRFAYDWRAEHLPTFDEELDQLAKHKIELTAIWFPTTLDTDARTILDALARHHIKTQLWVTGGGEPTKSPKEQAERVEAEAARIRPIAEAARDIGCTVALYNHGGWFGEPENQIAIIEKLDLPNVGIVYNLHHGHAHLDRFPKLLETMKPHLLALNLNGMVQNGEQLGKKILVIGDGDLDRRLLEIIRRSGWHGPIGILNHTDEDAETRLKANRDGLERIALELDALEPKP